MAEYKSKASIHPIGATIIDQNEKRYFVFGSYWNGKIDVRSSSGRESVMTIAAQKKCRRAKANDFIDPPTYQVSYIASSPEKENA